MKLLQHLLRLIGGVSAKCFELGRVDGQQVVLDGPIALLADELVEVVHRHGDDLHVGVGVLNVVRPPAQLVRDVLHLREWLEHAVLGRVLNVSDPGIASEPLAQVEQQPHKVALLLHRLEKLFVSN